MYGHKNISDGIHQRGWFPKLCVVTQSSTSKKDS